MIHALSQEPSEQDLRNALVVPGFELPSTVTKQRSVVMTRGLQPEDLGVLDFLKLRDPRVPATKEQLAEEMQALGWKMGKTRFDGCFRRLKTAGHIKHVCEHNPATGRPEWRIEFFLEPANNDQYVAGGAATSMQVRAETPVSGDTGPQGRSESRVSGVSPGQSESQVSGVPEANPRNPGFRVSGVSAGQSRNPGNPPFGSPPPHPPGVVTTPPTPPRPSAGAQSHPSPQGGEGDAAAPWTDEQLAAARAWLGRLPAPWTCGLEACKRIAPKLLEAASVQGWELDDELAAHLTRDPEGLKRHVQALEKNRIPDLVRREMVLLGATKQRRKPEGRCVEHPSFMAGDCPRCQQDERERRRGNSEPGPVDGAGLLARLRAGQPA